MNRNSQALMRPMVFAFIFLNAFLVAGKNMLARWGIDQSVVIVGNLVLFVLSILSFVLSSRALKSDNPNVFVRAMYTNFMIKLFVCVVVVFIYFMSAKKNINKPGLFVCMGLYVLYTVIEVASLTKLLREKKNA